MRGERWEVWGVRTTFVNKVLQVSPLLVWDDQLHPFLRLQPHTLQGVVLDEVDPELQREINIFWLFELIWLWWLVLTSFIVTFLPFIIVVHLTMFFLLILSGLSGYVPLPSTFLHLPSILPLYEGNEITIRLSSVRIKLWTDVRTDPWPDCSSDCLLQNPMT